MPPIRIPISIKAATADPVNPEAAAPDTRVAETPVPAAALPPEHQRIRTAIFKVVEHPNTPTSVKGLLSEYPAFIGARLRWPDFPVTLKQHPLHQDNASDPFITLVSGFGHHVGSTIKAYQQLHHMQKNKVNLTEQFKVDLEDAKVRLAGRLKQLEALAQAWPAVKNHPDNSPARGYSLVTADQYAEIMAKKAEKAEKALAAEAKKAEAEKE